MSFVSLLIYLFIRLLGILRRMWMYVYVYTTNLRIYLLCYLVEWNKRVLFIRIDLKPTIIAGRRVRFNFFIFLFLI